MSDPALIMAQKLQENFHKFGSFRSLSTYNITADSTYNTTSGKATPIVSASQPDIWIIFVEFSQTRNQSGINKEDEEPILSIDRLAVFPSLDLSIGTPSKGDTILDSNGVLWIVKGIGSDPKPAHFSLHVRPIG